MLNKTQRINLIVGYIILSFFFTYYILGYENLVLNNLFFTNKYDLLSDQLALNFFLNDDWHFPLGRNPNYGPADGSSIVFVGGAPIISFISKLIYTIFPNNFNFLVLWYFICFFLQLLIGYLIIFNFTKNFLFSIFSSFLFIFCPIFLDRIPNHLSLCGQWIILLCFYFEFQKSNSNRITFYSFLYVLASLIHFYFIPIILIIHFSFAFKRIVNENKIKDLIAEFAFPIFILLISAYITGYFEISFFDSMGYGYGYYKTNLLSFFDPQYSNKDINWSIFFNDIKNLKGEREGFSYLGLGIIILFVLQIIILFKSKKIQIKKKINFYLIIFISLILSISNNVNIASYELISYDLPKPIYALLSIVRAAGRFIWLVNYLIIIFGILAIYHLFKKKKYSLIAILVILSLQILDISPALKKYYNFQAFDKFTFDNHDENFWKKISNDFKHINSTKFSNTSDIYLSSANQILKYNFESTDISRMGRYSRKKVTKYRSKLNQLFSEKKFENNTVYLATSLNHLNYFKYMHHDSDVGFFLIEKNWFIVPGYKNKMTAKDFKNLSDINLFNVDINKHYTLELKENNILGIGWTHAPFGNGVWTEGNISSLIFKLNKDNQKDYKMLMNINSIMTKKDKKLNLEIKLNNILISKFSLSKDEIKKKSFLEIKIDNNLLNYSEQKIDIIVNNPLSPLDLFESPDSRDLGLLVSGFTITDND